METWWKAQTLFLSHNNITENKRIDVTYGWIVVDYHPQKYDLYHTHLTVGAKLIKYPGEVSTKTSDMTTAKLLFKCKISTPEANFMCCNIKYFYLGIPMDGIYLYLS